MDSMERHVVFKLEEMGETIILLRFLLVHKSRCDREMDNDLLKLISS
jgi:hypothetical protein